MTSPACDHPANALLPWHLNGTLDGAEAASFRTHLEGCPVCTRELRELVEIAAAAPLIRHEAARSRAASRIPMRALAAALLLPALLGIFISISRFRSSVGGKAPAEALHAVVKLDLGVGPVRGTEPLPWIAVPHGTRRVAVTLLLPVIPDGPLAIQLRGPSGGLLAESPARPDCQRGSGCTYLMPATLFAEPGRYSVVAAEPGSTGERGYSYPFLVGVSDPR